VVKLSDEEEVAEGVCSELHVVPLCGVLVLGGTRYISDTKEGVKGGFLPAAAWIGSVSEVDRWVVIGLLEEYFSGLVDGVQVGKV
jgi:hypothetical protein